MQTVTRYPDYYFCWISLATPDVESARTFYGSIFDWQFSERNWDNDSWLLARHETQTACALIQSPQESTPRWESYVCTRNIDVTLARAIGLGAQLVSAPADVADAGRVAEFLDPTGASLKLWQPRRHIGASIVNQRNAWIWNELNNADPEVAEIFYSDLFGWSTEVETVSTGQQTHFRLDDRLVCGMLNAEDEDQLDAPSCWSVAFAVDDCEVAAQQTIQAGGSVVAEPVHVRNVGRMATLKDPSGCTFQIIRTQIADPPPGC